MILVSKKQNLRFLITPIMYWLVLVTIFNLANTENSILFFRDLPGYDVWIRVVMFVLIPILIIKITGREELEGVFLTSSFGDSLKLALKTWAITGPTGALAFGTVLFFLELDVNSWTGSLIITTYFIVALGISIHIIGRYPDIDQEPDKQNTFTILVALIILVGAISVLLNPVSPILSGILVYIFIVGFGEEILFRGFLQTSLNIVFQRPFKIYGVEFGFGLIITAVLFGLTHALVQTPFEWQSATFTTAGGLIFGLIREKENSIMACGLLHAFMDLPKLFFTTQ